MVKREEFLPTQRSKVICGLLILLVIVVYGLENSVITLIVKSSYFTYMIKPSIWLGIAYMVWTQPKVRSKGRLKFKGLINLWAFNFAIIYVIISIMAGLLMDGLGKSPYSHTLLGILSNIAAIGSMILGRELIRNHLINNLKAKNNYLFFIVIALLMGITNIPFNKVIELKGVISLVKFIAEYLAPELCHNLLANYLVFLGGSIPSIIYFGIIQGFHWFSPILPDLKWITIGLIGTLCPVFFLLSMQNIYLESSKELKIRDKDRESPLGWFATSVISIGIIWFTVGVFPIYPSVIATGSMEPMIKPGDVILVEKIVDMEDINNLKIGDVIQFRKGSILISHRIIEIEEAQEGKLYKTQGDNNSGPDIDPVKPQDIKGKIVYVVPKVGWPTLLIKSDRDIPLEEIVF